MHGAPHPSPSIPFMTNQAVGHRSGMDSMQAHVWMTPGTGDPRVETKVEGHSGWVHVVFGTDQSKSISRMVSSMQVFPFVDRRVWWETTIHHFVAISDHWMWSWVAKCEKVAAKSKSVGQEKWSAQRRLVDFLARLIARGNACRKHIGWFPRRLAKPAGSTFGHSLGGPLCDEFYRECIVLHIVHHVNHFIHKVTIDFTHLYDTT